MKRLMYLTMCLCTMLLVMTACVGKNKSIVGKWELTFEIAGTKSVSVYEFNESGKFTMTTSSKSDSQAMNIRATGAGDYTYENNIITLKYDLPSYDIKEYAAEGIDEETSMAIMEQSKKMVGQVDLQLRVIKINGDEMIVIIDDLKGFYGTLKRI